MLRPNYFMQNLLWYIADIKSQGVFHASLPETYGHSHVETPEIARLKRCELQSGEARLRAKKKTKKSRLRA